MQIRHSFSLSTLNVDMLNSTCIALLRALLIRTGCLMFHRQCHMDFLFGSNHPCLVLYFGSDACCALLQLQLQRPLPVGYGSSSS